MQIVALAGGIGAGKFLRGLLAATEDDEVTVIINTGDDIFPYGVHVSPDMDSVIYWLSDAGDRERGWGRGDETFRATTELRERFAAETSWFNLGDLDLATNLFRTEQLRAGGTLSQVTDRIAKAFGLRWRFLPMSDDTITTRILTQDGRNLHFQEFWVREHAEPAVTEVRYAGAAEAAPAPGALEAIAAADVVIICPSNPIASIAPILAIPGYREALAAATVVGISPIVAGAPLRGMADKLLRAAGYEVTALGAAMAYVGFLDSWIIDERDRADARRITQELGVPVLVCDTVMPQDDDSVAEALAHVALGRVRA